MSFVMVLLFAFGGYSTPAREFVNDVDLVEFNRIYRFKENGEKAYGYEQIICWEWDSEYRRYNVRHWFIIENDPDDGYNGVFLVRSGEYYNIRIRGRHDSNQYNIRTKSVKYSECHCDEDPENLNKKLLPESQRLDLVPAKAKKRYPKTDDFDENGNLIIRENDLFPFR